MSTTDRGAQPTGTSGDDPRPGPFHRLVAAYRAWQDRMWRADEEWAAECRYTVQRSPSNWSITVRDPRFDLRQECWECDGTGRHRITGSECENCAGIGVVTLDPPDEEEP
jgi:hypothetical protein